MNIFIHYLDRELLDVYTNGYYTLDLIKKLIMSIKVAILLLDEQGSVIVPVSNYYESELARHVLDVFRDLVDLQILVMPSSSSSLSTFWNKKKLVYPSRYEMIEQIVDRGIPGKWQSRKRSATEDIIMSWSNSLDSPVWEQLYSISEYNSIENFQNHLSIIPEKIKDKAFVVKHVLPELKVQKGYYLNAQEIINKMITQAYIESFLIEYDAVCFRDFFTITNDILPQAYNHISYATICKNLFRIPYEKDTLYQYIFRCDVYQLINIKEKISVIDLMQPMQNNRTIFTLGGSKMGTSKILISHAEKDAQIVDCFVELLFQIGIRKTDIIYTSMTECGVPQGMDIYDYLRDKISTSNLISFFMLSQNYYESAACLNEMGAVWMKQSQYFSILLPEFHFTEIKGAINPAKKALYLGWSETKLKEELTVLKDQICNIFAISISELTWEKYRDDFVEKISRIDSEINIDLKQSTGMCIGMQRHNGVKVAYDNSLRQLLGKVNFSKTSADLCSIIIYTGELKIKRKFELGKNLKFSMKASDSTKKVTVELLLIGDNGKVMNAKYEISASEDWTDYKEYK